MTEKCSGVKLNGPHRGRPCNSIAQYVFRGRHYCAAHRTIAAAAPEEFTAAKATLGRKLVKLAETEAQRAAQMDAFPVVSDQEAEVIEDAYRDHTGQI